MYENIFCKNINNDKYTIWNILVKKDIIAFENSNWEYTSKDFSIEHFMGINARNSNNPDDWELSFPDLGSYARKWKEQRIEFGEKNDPVKLAADIYAATSLREIEVNRNMAIAHKKFNGTIELRNQIEGILLKWQTIYFLKKINSNWKITGFIGYLPYKF